MNDILNLPLSVNNFKFLFSKFLFGFFSLKISYRTNYLSISDFRITKRLIRKGDLVLVGDFKTMSGLFMGKQFTHSLLYIGKGKCVHASGKGVQKILLKKVFKVYDTITILRPEDKNINEKTIENCIKFAKKQVGKPYDFYLKSVDNKYYCTNLVNSAFIKAGFNTGVSTKTNSYWLYNRIKEVFKAEDFLKANFKTVYSSLNNNK